MAEPPISTRAGYNSGNQYNPGPNPSLAPQGTYPPQPQPQQPPLQPPPPPPPQQQQPLHPPQPGQYADSAHPIYVSDMPMPPPELLQQTYGTNYEANHAPETQHLTGDPAGISPHAAPGGDEKRSQRRGILDYVTQFISAPKAQGEGSLFNMPDWLSRLPCIGAKYALVAILFILILVACIVILMYLTLSKDQNCGGGRCNSLGESGLYLSAFGDCHVWYGAPNNTCKNWKSSDTMFAAINYYQFGLYDKLQWSPVCNKCVRIQGPRGTIEAKITDICQNCTYGSIMLSEPAFVLIADDGVDNVPVNWGPC